MSGNGGSGVVAVKELSKASGVWNLRSQFAARKQGTWPVTFLHDVDYLVVAGGGGRGGPAGGGGGAGGYRASGYGPSPLQGDRSAQFTSESYTVAVGAGG